MSEYFPKPKSLRANGKLELDLSNYATRAGADTSDLAKRLIKLILMM